MTVVRLPKSFHPQMIVHYMESSGFTPPAIIHIHSLQFLRLFEHYKRRGGIPTVYTCHSLVGERGTNKVFTPKRQAALLCNADSTVVPSDALLRKLVRKYPSCRDKTIVIPHGVRVYSGDITQVSGRHLLYAGRLVHNKGLPQLIDAMAYLRRKHPEAQLSIIGAGSEKYVSKLRLRAKKNRVASAVHWLGHYKHQKLQAAYRRFAAVVMPSRQESFGLVALEALAQGVPLVATRAGGLGSFVTSDVAEVISEVSGLCIASAIAAMWAAPDQTRARIAAGKDVALKYQWSGAAEKYSRLFQQLCRTK